MTEENMQTERSRKAHQVVNTWSPYSRLGPGFRVGLKGIVHRFIRSSELATMLRYEVDMMLLRAWNRVSPAFRRRVAGLKKARELKVNIGCGNDVLEGWLNVDSYAESLQSQDVMLVDIREGLPLEGGSARYVYLEHFLEHLDHEEVVPLFLRDMHRILCPGGAIRIIVPDARRILEAYFDRSHEARRVASEHAGSWMEFINFVARGTGHKYLYDAEVLIKDLRRAGFRDAYACGPGEGRFAELLQDNHDPVRRAMSLYVEAVK